MHNPGRQNDVICTDRPCPQRGAAGRAYWGFAMADSKRTYTVRDLHQTLEQAGVQAQALSEHVAFALIRMALSDIDRDDRLPPGQRRLNAVSVADLDRLMERAVD